MSRDAAGTIRRICFCALTLRLTGRLWRVAEELVRVEAVVSRLLHDTALANAVGPFDRANNTAPTTAAATSPKS